VTFTASITRRGVYGVTTAAYPATLNATFTP